MKCIILILSLFMSTHSLGCRYTRVFKKAAEIVKSYQNDVKLFLYLEHARKIGIKSVSDDMTPEEVLRKIKKSPAYNYDNIVKINNSVYKKDTYYSTICTEAKQDFQNLRYSREELVEFFESCYGFVDTDYTDNILSFFHTNKNKYKEMKLVCGYDSVFVDINEFQWKSLKRKLK